MLLAAEVPPARAADSRQHPVSCDLVAEQWDISSPYIGAAHVHAKSSAPILFLVKAQTRRRFAGKLLIIPFPVDLGAVASAGSSALESSNVPLHCNTPWLLGESRRQPTPVFPLDGSLPTETSCQGCPARTTASSCAALPACSPLLVGGPDPRTRYLPQVQQTSCFVLIPILAAANRAASSVGQRLLSVTGEDESAQLRAIRRLLHAKHSRLVLRDMEVPG